MTPNLKKIAVAVAACMLSLPAAAAITFTGESGSKSDGYTTGGVSFYNTVGSGSMIVSNYGGQSNGEAIGAFNDGNGNALKMTFAATSFISMSFGNDDAGFTNPGDLALLQVYSGATLVGQTTVLLNRNDLMDQTISWSGGTFDSAIFSYVDPTLTPFTGGGNANTGLIEIVDDIQVGAIPEPETYAMLLAGLGLMGFAARRRKQKQIAA